MDSWIHMSHLIVDTNKQLINKILKKQNIILPLVLYETNSNDENPI